jgi:hypothetical protein
MPVAELGGVFDADGGGDADFFSNVVPLWLSLFASLFQL